MRLILLYTVLVFGLPFSAYGEVVRLKPNVAGYPTKAGEYIHKQWKYVYVIENKGTRSERRIGRLYLEGKPVEGKLGELNQELFGHFIYFGKKGYNQGWLNTLTYDRRVFDNQGGPTKEASRLLADNRKPKKQ